VVIRFNHVAPHLYAADLERSRTFYERVLGFSVDYSDGEPPHYIVVCRDDVYLHLSHLGPLGVPQQPGAAFLVVADIDSLWTHVSAERACVVSPLADTEYGRGVRFRVFAVRDPDGNVLRIGEPSSGVAT
jgi:catechol 2,3-dioxygenase-like lactoylglutathione lyase family enzyme